MERILRKNAQMMSSEGKSRQLPPYQKDLKSCKSNKVKQYTICRENRKYETGYYIDVKK